MRKRLLDIYADLKESASTSDFPYLLGNTLHKELITAFKGFPSSWPMFCKKGNLSDFKTHDRVILSEAPDPSEVEENGPYTGISFKDYRYQIQAGTFGSTFTIGRKAIINDDKDGISQFPQKMGRAMVRKMIKAILTPLKGGPLAYDGKVLFHDDHANFIAATALANSAAGAAAVAAACQKLKAAADPHTSEILGLTPKYLITGTTLGLIAKQLINSALIWPVSTTGGADFNVLKNLIVIEEPLLDSQVSATFWAIMADPADCPVIEIGFLDGKEDPDLLVKKADTVSLAGGAEDSYGYEFDDISYKVRHDWGVKTAMYQGIVRGNG